MSKFIEEVIATFGHSKNGSIPHTTIPHLQDPSLEATIRTGGWEIEVHTIPETRDALNGSYKVYGTIKIWFYADEAHNLAFTMAHGDILEDSISFHHIDNFSDNEDLENILTHLGGKEDWDREYMFDAVDNFTMLLEDTDELTYHA